MKRLILSLAAALCLAPALAQDWPSKPIRLIVPFPAGGPTDLVAREAANILREEFKQTVIVDNKPGGNGTLGHAVLAKSPADGYTIGLLVITVAIAPHLGNAPFDTFKDFAPISNMVSMTPIVVANNNAPFNTLAELSRHAKANPGQLAFGTPGVATVPHLAAELFQMQSGTHLNHIPYKGATQQIQDLIGGSTQLDFQSSLVVAMPQIKAERIKALAVLSRMPTMEVDRPPTNDLIVSLGSTPPKPMPKAPCFWLVDRPPDALYSARAPPWGVPDLSRDLTMLVMAVIAATAQPI